MAYTRTHKFDRQLSRSYYQDSSSSTSIQTFSQSDTKSGTRVERWRELIARASPAGSPYNRTAWRFDAEESSCSVSGYYKPASSVKRKVGGSGVLLPLQIPKSLGVSSPEAKALSRFYDSIRDKQEGMNGLLVLGELRETIKMLRRPGEGLLSLFNDYLGTAKGLRKEFSSRKGTNAKRLTKALSDLWLEYSFGWKPLISDVKDAAATVARIAHDNALRTDRAKGSASDSKAQTDPPFTDGEFFTVFPGVVFRHNRQYHSEVGVRYVGGVKASTYGPTDTFEGVARETGLTLANFVPTVWNLIPYSFLVDYFVNVGDCIDAVFTDTSSLSWWSKSVRNVDTVQLNSTFDAAATRSTWTGADYEAQVCTGTGGLVHVVRTTLARTVGDATTLPVPGLTLSMPAVDSSKYWNLFALFGSRAAGAHRP